MRATKNVQPAAMATKIDLKFSLLADTKAIAGLVEKFDGVVSCRQTFPEDKNIGLKVWWTVDLTPMPLLRAKEIVSLLGMIDGVTFSRETVEKVSPFVVEEEEVLPCTLPPSTLKFGSRLYSRL